MMSNRLSSNQAVVSLNPSDSVISEASGNIRKLKLEHRGQGSGAQRPLRQELNDNGSITIVISGHFINYELLQW